jgi:uncharacterized protein (TIGR02099 family)
MNGENIASTPSARPKRTLRWLRWIVLGFVLLVILFFASIFAIRSWLLPDLTVLQPRIEAKLSEVLKQPVRLQGLGIQWNWASADLALGNIVIGSADAPVLQASGIKTTLLAHPLLWGTLQTSAEGLHVDALTIAATQTGAVATPQWRVAGLDMSAPSDGAGLRWALAQPSINIAALNITAQDHAKHWLPEGRNTLALTELALTASGLGGREHRVSAQFAPAYNDPRFGKNVRLEAQFNHGVLTDAAAFKQWSGQATVNIPNAHIARSVAWILPLAKTIPAGQAQQWQRWAQQSAADARLASSTLVQFDEGKLRASGKLAISGLPKAYTGSIAPLLWSWKPTTIATTAAITKAMAGIDNHTFDSEHAVQIGSDQLSLAPLASLLRGAPLDAAIQAAMTQAQAHGTLTKVLIDATINAHGVQSLTAHANAQQLGLRSVDIVGKKGVVNIPTVEGISGTVKVNHSPAKTLTHIVLDSHHAYADLPRLLDEPRVSFDTLAGEIDVTLTPQSVDLALNKVRFSNTDVAGELNGQYSIATQQNVSDKNLGTAKFTGAFTRADLAQLHRYMPLTLSDNARAWLRHTIAAGQAEQLQFTLNGDLARFPFLSDVARAGERFDLHAVVNKAVLNFNPLAPLNLPSSLSATTTAVTTPRALAGSAPKPNATANASANAIKPWPLIENVAGELRLNGLSLTLLNMTGDAAAIPLRVPKLTIASLTAPVVVFQTKATAAAQSVLDLIRTTPLSEALGEQFGALKFTGNVGVDANLTIDTAQPKNALYQATVVADQVSLQLSSELPPIERLNAKLNIQQSKAIIEQASAFWMGGIVQASGVLDTQNPAETLRVVGTAQLADIKQNFPNPMVQALLSHAQGGVDYGLDIAFKPEGVGWQVKADLKNTALQWPGLLDKAVGVPLPFTLTRSPTQRTVFAPASPEQRINQDVWEASLGASLLGPFKATVERRLDSADWRIVRGAVALGDAAELNTPDQGLGIHIVTAKANLDQLRSEVEALPWKALPPLTVTKDDKEKNTKASNNTTAQLPAWMPSVLALQVDDLTLANRHFYNVVGAAVRDTAGAVNGHHWSANLVAKGINGYFSWADTSTSTGVGGGALIARLTELNIPNGEVERTSKTLLRLAPEQVPSIDVTVDQLTIADKSLGRVTIKATNLAKDIKQLGWNIDALSITLPHAKLNASGQWVQAANAADGDGQVALKLSLETDSLGDTMDGFGYGKIIAGAAGKLTGDIRWQGTPFGVDLPSLSGNLNAAFEKGQFLKVDPGAGKLIGLFSLQNLPRRLTLDFKDTFDKGFAFNYVKANASIEKGVLTTDDFFMAGSIADVKAIGTVSLVDETQALTFTVKPDFNAGSLSLLYMIINPPLGLATLAAQYLFKEPISRAFTLQYAITGSWAQPDVKQIKREFQ